MRIALVLMSMMAVALAHGAELRVERVTTKVPFPRGLAMAEGKLMVLCRGRVRGAGGVSAEVEDQAGTLYAVDPQVTEPIDVYPVGTAVRQNGEVVARPDPDVFRLWDRAANPPWRDRYTDRPYCTLRYHEPSRNLYLCAFSGVDKPRQKGSVSFSKNLTDAVLRYDLRTKRWHEVDRHNIEAGGNYPHHDPRHNPPPHGWLAGPDNCLALGRWLYVVAKDNNLLVRYDLDRIIDDPAAGPPPSTPVVGEKIDVEGHGKMSIYGHSALAYHDGWLYLGTRTSSLILRLPVDENYLPVQPVRAQLVARFTPYDPETMKSANVTDMAFDDQGRLYVISAKPSRVYRFTPGPQRVFDAREGGAAPWADMAKLTDNPSMKSENVLCHDGWCYVTSGDGYDYQKGAAGTLYRVKIDD